jgi:hypothetical protein
MRQVGSDVHGGKIENTRRCTCTSCNGQSGVDNGIERVGAVREDADSDEDEQQEEAEESGGG